ncbi:SemiSWEET family sugar transporter [Flavobacterium sp. RHBU_24]|uniref:SemiSWEET family sugar transporter n=1 Tax=Flavobacterium sp. RHBU_24 TaxID=3391185 RepID=UPI003984F209
MDATEILGLIAAGITTLANIPQTVKVIKTKSTKSISAFTYSLLTIGMATWVVYGILQSDLPIIIGNSIATALCGTILFVKLYMKLSKQEKED